MNDPDNPDNREFQRKIFRDLDDKLRSTDWKSGACEAHGLLAGLACRGVKPVGIANKMYLLRASDPDHVSLLEGLFELIVRDLESPQPVFPILLPDNPESNQEQAEGIASWCQGYLQGMYNDSGSIDSEFSQTTKELLEDIMNIGNMDTSSIDEDNHDDERSLVEIEEYLRVGIQMIYDELVSEPRKDDENETASIH